MARTVRGGDDGAELAQARLDEARQDPAAEMRAVLAGKVECYDERPRLVRVEALGNGERVEDRGACPGLSGGFFPLQR